MGGQWKLVDVIVFDFSKAFDTVTHKIILNKMSSSQLEKHIMCDDVTLQ